MSIKVLDTVVLEANLPAHGLKCGDIGAVVEVYSPEAVEVEFVTAQSFAALTRTCKLLHVLHTAYHNR